MPCGLDLRPDAWRLNGRHFGKCLVVARRYGAPPCQVRFQTLQLRDSQRAGDVAQAVVVAQRRHLVLPLPLIFSSPRVTFDSMISKLPQPAGEPFAVGGHHSAFAAGDVLYRMKTEDAHVADAAYAPLL